MLIPQSASGIVRTFLLTKVEDHINGYAGGAPVQVRISKNGAAFAPAESGAPVLLESGIYKYVYTPNEVNTLGPLMVSCRASGADPTDFLDEVVGFDPRVAWQTKADIENRLNEYGAVRPTVSGRLALLGAGGHIGIDWANVANPTTAVGLTNTTISGVLSAAPPGPTSQDIWSYGTRTVTQSVGTSTLTNTDIQNRLNEYGALRPTVSGRLLAVNATNQAGIDWANIGAPNTEVSLGGTTIRGSGMIITAVTGAVGSVTGNVGGNVVGSIGSIASSGIVISSLQPEASNEIADRVLRRGLANVEQVADPRSLAWGVAKLVNKISLTANTLTVTKTDDTTSLFSQAVTTSGGALPIVAADTN
ncbi:MAG TPA: hypothetical protein VNN55_03050 [bacterium]|nr:hypothetical protein [bacterium]